MNLTTSQAIIARDSHRFRVVNCGRRFGKTTLAVLEMVAKGIYGRDRKICYIAPTYQQAKDIAWQEVKKITQPIISKISESAPQTVYVKTVDDGTSMITLRGWESVETLRGQAFDLLVLDEVSSYKDFWVNWHEVLRPTLTDRKGHALFISTPKGFNHFYDLYRLESKDDDYKSFHFTSYDNPHIPKEEVDKARKELTEDRFAQEYMADFRKTEGLVYKEFSRDRHIFKGDWMNTAKGKAKLFGGVDFGFTNPCAILSVIKDSDNKYFVTDEFYKTRHTDTQIADYVSVLRWNECYPDPESASGVEELKRRGVNVREVIKNKDSIRNGINVIRELLMANRLFIHESCVNLITEFETYRYPEKRSDHNEEENPIKENDHALDALRYALSMEPSNVPINIPIVASAPIANYYPELGI